MSSTIPNAPVDAGPPTTWPHYQLYQGVRDALHRLPESFRSPLNIHGVLATDLFAFNSSLSATIEEQVVDALNGLRGVWDPGGNYDLYAFERQPQTFPDVVLRTRAPGKTPAIILGLELKGWYALAKEGEPSFRYKVTPAVCGPADLIVIVPWTLSAVISGTPIVHDPYIAHAAFAAEYRNWWWTYGKNWKASGPGGADPGIDLSDITQNYPTKSDAISDRPRSDGGSNFGRFARTGLMDDYIKDLFATRLSGIPLGAWQQFFRIFTEGYDFQDIEEKIGAIEVTEQVSGDLRGTLERIAAVLIELAQRISRPG
jgi:hypothetical protein